MKFRLDTQHYINDRLLEPGHIIGDETDVPMQDPYGRPMKPSVNMTPLDDEAESLFKKTFPGDERPQRDPTKAIPLRGTGDTAKSPAILKDDNGRVVQPGSPPVNPDVVHVDKKGLPDTNSPNHPVGQPVQGTTGAASGAPSPKVPTLTGKEPAKS